MPIIGTEATVIGLFFFGAGRRGLAPAAGGVAASVMVTTGWCDGDQTGAFYYWRGMQARPGGADQYLTVGPWTHIQSYLGGSEKMGELALPKESILDNKAMHLALDQLSHRPGLILIDGNRFKAYNNVPYQCVVGGDGLYASIAAASILAKTHRDEYMQTLHLEHPEYGWDVNKGYGTPIHREAIRVHGISPYHRKSFRMGQEELMGDLFAESEE